MSLIPRDLFIAKRKEQHVKVNEDRISVVPAFMVPADSPKFVSAAKAWSRQYNSGLRRNQEGEFTNQENIPVSGVKIVGLSVRSGGGRAYKAIYPPNYLVDLRESVLLDVIQNEGINAGGEMNGRFLWSVNGSQMRLIRVGSNAYQEIVNRQDLNSLKRIPIKELEPGGIYVGKTTAPGLFLGFISTIFMKPYWTYRTYRGGHHYERNISDLEVYKRKAMLWFSVYNRRKKPEDVVAGFNKLMNRESRPGGHVSVVTGHSMRKRIGSLPLEPTIVYEVRDLYRSGIFEQVRADDQQRHRRSYYERVYRFINNSPLLNMVPYGEDPIGSMLPECERILEECQSQ